jgi:hypothetical protein
MKVLFIPPTKVCKVKHQFDTFIGKYAIDTEDYLGQQLLQSS